MPIFREHPAWQILQIENTSIGVLGINTKINYSNQDIQLA